MRKASNQAQVLSGRIGGVTRASRISDMQAAMAPAWRGSLARFEREVDPDGTLPPDERDRRAKAARSAHMARLAYRRHRAAKLRREAAAVDAELTWLAAWDARGRPAPKASAGGFGKWIAAVRGVLGVAGVPGTFDDTSSQNRVANPDTEKLEAFYQAVRDVMGTRAFTVKGLLQEVKFAPAYEADGRTIKDDNAAEIALGESLPGDLAEKAARSGRPAVVARSLGKWLGNHAGQWYGGLTIRPTGEHSKAGVTWRVMAGANTSANTSRPTPATPPPTAVRGGFPYLNRGLTQPFVGAAICVTELPRPILRSQKLPTGNPWRSLFVVRAGGREGG